MKKILILLLGIAAAIPALCQFPDTTQLGKRLVPTSYESVYIDHIPVQYEKTIDKYLNSGGLINYIVGTGNTHPNTMVRVLATQIAMNADVKPEELIMLQNFINEIVKPGVYVPPTGGGDPGPTPIVLKAHINDQGSAIVFDPGWQKVPANPSMEWLDKFFQKDVTITSTTGVWASYPFRGKRIELIGEKCDNHGKAKVEILKGTTVIKSETVDMYQQTFDAAGNPATLTNWCPAGVVTALFTSGDLPLDDYVIRFKFDSNDLTKVPRRDSMVIDGVKIYE